MPVSRALSHRAAALAATLSIVAALAGCTTPAATVQPSRVAVDGLPNGIALRPGDNAVFITDDRTSSVLLSTGGAFTSYAAIPVAPGQGKSLSQLTFTDSGALFVERFGFGSASAIFEITGASTPAALTGPDPARRRLGLLAMGPGQLLSTWFIKNGDSPPQGGLSLVSYDEASHTATERDLMTGLGKPVGVVVWNGNVFVADQANNNIVRASLSALLGSSEAVTPTVAIARIDSPDLLAVDTQGKLYTKCNKSGLCEIAPDGTVRVLSNDFQTARGVAVDARHHLLYAIDRGPSAGGTSYMRTFPLK
jgi:DNA-binding beta-propeller fold protein YncE